MKIIINYNEELDILTIECDCDHIFDFDLSEYLELEYLEEFNQYQNINIPCSNCNGINVINSNIGVSEYEDRIFEDIYAQYYEINKRKTIRDILWKKRADLKKLDREKYNEERKHLYQEQKEITEELLLMQKANKEYS